MSNAGAALVGVPGRGGTGPQGPRRLQPGEL